MHSVELPSPIASRQHRQSRGFTLIELMIVVSIVGILSSVALPGLEGQLQKARRADALVSVMQIQSAQERFRGNNSGYGALADIGLPSVSPGKHYILQTNPTGSDGFEVLATAIGVQARGALCRYMKLSRIGANLAYASGPEASVANTAGDNHACWML